MCAPPQACAHAHFPFLTVTPTLSTARLFLPPASGSHTRRAIRAGTGLSPAAATTVAHFSDDRGRIQARMVNGTPEISLSFSLARVILPFECLVFGFFATPCLSFRPSPSAPRPKLPICRSVVVPRSLPPSPYSAWRIPVRIPINKKNTPGRPQNGSSFTRSPLARRLLSTLRNSVRMQRESAPPVCACVRACVRANRVTPWLVDFIPVPSPCTINLRLAPG